jgi:flagellar assembly factor FliW
LDLPPLKITALSAEKQYVVYCATVEAPVMIIETARFGLIDVDGSTVINMPRGMFGFEDRTEYCLIQHQPGTTFRWLQSTSDPELAFVVVDPSHFFGSFDIKLTAIEAECLGLETSDDAMVLATVSLDAGTSEVTANLAGPIVINSKSLTGLQVALDDQRYGTRHRLGMSAGTDGEALPKAA